MKQIVVALLSALCLLFGAQSVVHAGTCPKGKGGCLPTKLVEKQLPPPAKKCIEVKSVGTTAVTYVSPSVPAMFTPASCCCGGSGTFSQAVSGQYLSTETVHLKSTLVCEDEKK